MKNRGIYLFWLSVLLGWSVHKFPGYCESVGKIVSLLNLSVCICFAFFSSALANISDWNSFRTNTKFFESFRNLYPDQKISFLSNSKNFLKTELIRGPLKINPIESGQSELIRINRNLQSAWIRSIRWNRIFLESIGLIRIDRTHLDCKFALILINSDWLDSVGLIFNGPRIDSDWKISSN